MVECNPFNLVENPEDPEEDFTFKDEHQAKLALEDPALNPRILQQGIHFLVSRRYLKDASKGSLSTLDMVDYLGEDFSFTLTDFDPHSKLKDIK